MTVWKLYAEYWQADPIAAFLDTLIAALLIICAIKYG